MEQHAEANLRLRCGAGMRTAGLRFRKEIKENALTPAGIRKRTGQIPIANTSSMRGNRLTAGASVYTGQYG